MARIAGIDLPKNKRGEIGLTYIYGIGLSTAQEILDRSGIDRNKKVNQWNVSLLVTLDGVLAARLYLIMFPSQLLTRSATVHAFLFILQIKPI